MKPKSKHFERWPAAILTEIRPVLPRYDGLRHVLLAVCDHHDAENRPSNSTRARQWVDAALAWRRRFETPTAATTAHLLFPARSIGPSPSMGRNTDPRAAGPVSPASRNSTETSLRAEIEAHPARFAGRGHFSRSVADRSTRSSRQLARKRAARRRMCGVDAEPRCFSRRGCYADFTFPSVPDVSQPNVAGPDHWPTGIRRGAAYEYGQRARAGESRPDRCAGPGRPRSWIASTNPVPRLEYGA
jgi:hypothetical protein